MSPRPSPPSTNRRKSAKAACAADVRVLTDIPNIGVSMANDLQGLGIATPQAVAAMDPLHAYESLRGSMGERHDPCVLDAFLAAHDFMNGGPSQPWWNFTEQRKTMLSRAKQPSQ